MTPLLDKEKRARAQAARRRRREEIIAAASHLFVRQPYSDITLDTIGRRIGVAKGLASLHFPTKEDLFLEVLKRELSAWFDVVERRLQDGGDSVDTDRLTEIFVTELAERPTLTRLLAVLHNVVEQNVEVLSAQDFVDWMRERALALGQLLDERCADFEAGDGAVFLRRLAVVAIGLRQTASPSGIFAALLLDEAFAPFEVGLEEELRSLIGRILPRRADTN
jgi:AcrR family transcriptional regulator